MQTVPPFIYICTTSAAFAVAAWDCCTQVLSCATTETDNPDLRDRAYIYWRLLSTDPEVRAAGAGHRQ
eukprot:1161958-Pelagomonas_calceolata.AAC.7